MKSFPDGKTHVLNLSNPIPKTEREAAFGHKIASCAIEIVRDLGASQEDRKIARNQRIQRRRSRSTLLSTLCRASSSPQMRFLPHR